MPVWYKDDFELKATERQQIWKDYSALPCLPKSRAPVALYEGVLPHQEGKSDSNLWRWRATSRLVCIDRPY